jgi:hypothetical protein
MLLPNQCSLLIVLSGIAEKLEFKALVVSAVQTQALHG